MFGCRPSSAVTIPAPTMHATYNLVRVESGNWTVERKRSTVERLVILAWRSPRCSDRSAGIAVLGFGVGVRFSAGCKSSHFAAVDFRPQARSCLLFYRTSHIRHQNQFVL